MNRTLVELLADREAELHSRGIQWRITGVASRRLGWIADASGLEAAFLATLESPGPEQRRQSNVREWLAAARADVLFEATSLNVEDGQPAVDYLRAALERGAHAITANKGPIVYAYRELSELAEHNARRFLFEATVMDGVPVFSLFRENLPLVHLQGFRGILNSTTNIILGGMETGLSFEEMLQKARESGVAETDARHDIDGWDAAVKVAALVAVLMGERLRLSEIPRQGIGALTAAEVRAARAAGTPYKLVCAARRTEAGVAARVGPEKLSLSDPLARVEGTSSMLCFETDIFPKLTITEDHPGLYATAYGMLADFVRAVG